MRRHLARFLDGFVMPLLRGGRVDVGAPIRTRDYEVMCTQGELLEDRELHETRVRLARAQFADPDLRVPDNQTLAFWAALHNVLALDNPGRARVWARPTAWLRVEQQTRAWLAADPPLDFAAALGRHVDVAALLDLQAEKQPEESDASRIVAPRRRAGTSDILGTRWMEERHTTEVARLLRDVALSSPLTCLLRPMQAPEQWSPLGAAHWLHAPAIVRGVCYAWAKEREWVRLGGRVMHGLLHGSAVASWLQPEGGSLLALPGADRNGDDHVTLIVCALIHLHFLKVLELDIRLSTFAVHREPGVQEFLALPRILPWIHAHVGGPLSGATVRTGAEHEVERRWQEYVDHLEDVVARQIVENVVASVVPRIVKVG